MPAAAMTDRRYNLRNFASCINNAFASHDETPPARLRIVDLGTWREGSLARIR